MTIFADNVDMLLETFNIDITIRTCKN